MTARGGTYPWWRATEGWRDSCQLVAHAEIAALTCTKTLLHSTDIQTPRNQAEISNSLSSQMLQWPFYTRILRTLCVYISIYVYSTNQLGLINQNTFTWRYMALANQWRIVVALLNCFCFVLFCSSFIHSIIPFVKTLPLVFGLIQPTLFVSFSFFVYYFHVRK